MEKMTTIKVIGMALAFIGALGVLLDISTGHYFDMLPQHPLFLGFGLLLTK